MTKGLPAGRYSNASHQWHKTAQAHLGWIPSRISQTYLWSLHEKYSLNILKVSSCYTTSYSFLSLKSLHRSQNCIAAAGFPLRHHSWVKMQWYYYFSRWLISGNVSKQRKWLETILLPHISSCSKHLISLTVNIVYFAESALLITRPLFRAVRFILTDKSPLKDCHHAEV